MPHYYELHDFYLVHGGFNFNAPNPLEDKNAMLWRRMPEEDTCFGGSKKIIHAHQPQPLESGKVYAINIRLGEIYHRLSAGSRLQVDIVSSNFPRRARSTNSGHPVMANDSEADLRVATNTIYHAAATPSWVEISVLPDNEEGNSAA